MYHTTKHKFIVAGLVLAVALLNGAYAASGLDENGFLKPEVEKVEGCFGYMRLDNGVQVRVGDVYKNIIFYSP